MNLLRASSMKLMSSAGADNGVSQLLGRQAFERFVEGEGVQEDGAGDVGCIRRQATMMFGVDFLSQRL